MSVGNEVALGRDVSADYVGDVIGKAQLPEGLCSNSIVGNDANAGHLPAFDGPDVAQVVQEGCDDLLVAATVLACVIGRLQGVFDLRDSLAGTPPVRQC